MSDAPCPPCKYPDDCACEQATAAQAANVQRPASQLLTGHVLDVLAALRLGRRFIGIELSEKYADMAREKLCLWWRDARLVEAERPESQAVLPFADQGS